MIEPTAPRPLRADARRNRARVLEAAEAAFAADGLIASIEEIARRAGVGVGTVYRHFPNKDSLFEAIVVSRLEGLAGEANALSSATDPGAAFFGLFTRMIEEASAKKAFADALARAGVDVKAATSAVGIELRRAFEVLLTRAQQSGAVRADADIDQVIALVAGASMAAEQGNFNRDVRSRALAVIFDGLRPTRGR